MSPAGRELDLRKFHEAVQECGGFDAAVSNKKFARIAVRLGIDLAVATNAAYLLKWGFFCMSYYFCSVVAEPKIRMHECFASLPVCCSHAFLAEVWWHGFELTCLL
jgi:hypothetical protein